MEIPACTLSLQARCGHWDDKQPYGGDRESVYRLKISRSIHEMSGIPSMYWGMQ